MPQNRATSPSAALQRLYRVSDASWPPAGIRKPAVADLMRPVGFRPETPSRTSVLMPFLNTPKFRPNIGQKINA
jgi:hypothetical protein